MAGQQFDAGQAGGEAGPDNAPNNARDNAFWRYSLALYRQPGVSGACLRLQREHGADVNLLLFCCWLAAGGRALTTALLARARAASEPWQARVVGPLRAVRDHLRPARGDPATGRLRQAVLTAELAAEQIQQSRLFALAGRQDDGESGRATTPAALAAANLHRYLGGRVAETARPQLRVILDAAFPGPGEAAKLSPADQGRESPG